MLINRVLDSRVKCISHSSMTMGIIISRDRGMNMNVAIISKQGL